VRLRSFALAVAAAAVGAGPALGDPVADFYGGKTIRVLIGVGEGGGFDLQARLVGRHIRSHLPGQPNVLPQNMAGAAGMNAANYLYNAAPKDGTAIGMMLNSIVALQATQGRGVNFDADKMGWIGSPEHMNVVVYALKASGIRTIDDLRLKPVVAASSARGAITYVAPRLMNELLGTKLKIITGYQGSNSLLLAVERGEADVAVEAWPSFKTRKPEWFAENKVSILVHSDPGERELAGIPTFEGLAANDNDRRIIGLVLSGNELGKPLAAPPGVPPERLKALRDAFDATMKDPDYRKDATTTGFDLAPVRGADLQKRVQQVLATPQELVARAKEIME